MDYEIDIQIDETALDIEWLEQPGLAMKYGIHFAECKRKVAAAEEAIKVLRSDLIRKANEDPERYCNKEKPNAADIEAFYRNRKSHKLAKEKLIQLQYELDIAEVAKNEISYSRKAALEHLVKLHGQQYFAGPKMPRELTSEIEKKAKMQKEVHAHMGPIKRRNK